MLLGADYVSFGKTRFFLWAPSREQITLHIVYPKEQRIKMSRDKKEGYWYLDSKDIYPGCQYYYQLDWKEEYPDPASHFQPEGVHGPSQVVDHSFLWEDQNWPGIHLKDMIVYELHVGTFTLEGNFNAIITRLDKLADMGINTIELMPVAQFPGKRNWGYDGVYPFAVQNSYGIPVNLKELVNACHLRGIAVILDVVYNHLGPEGNVLPQFGPYFSEKYHSNWGQGINFNGPFSDEVRDYFIQNALYWFEKYHFDGLRLDAIHGIFDMRATHFLAGLSSAVRKFSQKKKKKYYLIAESDLNDNKIVRSRYKGGYQLDAQWSDDYHHALHTMITGEKTGYYQDFGKIRDLAKAIKEGFVYSGQYSSFRKKSHGNSSRFIPKEQLVVYAQNHDQVGNRMLGERLTSLTSFAALKLVAATTILSPYVPLLFMGEEYGEESPFLYFIEHGDQDLVQAVRKGRKEEFTQFQWQQEPPDPQDKKTFEKSKIHWQKRKQGHHAVLLDFYRELLQLRKRYPLLQCPDRKQIRICSSEETKVLVQQRIAQDQQFLLLSNFHCGDSKVKLKEFDLSSCSSKWDLLMDSNQQKWLGDNTFISNIFPKDKSITMKPYQFVLYKAKGVNNKNGKE
jgi:maltooligosyltrehalose trehalohydrolase